MEEKGQFVFPQYLVPLGQVEELASRLPIRWTWHIISLMNLALPRYFYVQYAQHCCSGDHVLSIYLFFLYHLFYCPHDHFLFFSFLSAPSFLTSSLVFVVVLSFSFFWFIPLFLPFSNFLPLCLTFFCLYLSFFFLLLSFAFILASAQYEPQMQKVYENLVVAWNDLNNLLTVYPNYFDESGIFCTAVGTACLEGPGGIASGLAQFAANITSVQSVLRPLQIGVVVGSYGYTKVFVFKNGCALIINGFSAFVIDPTSFKITSVDDYVDVKTFETNYQKCMNQPPHFNFIE